MSIVAALDKVLFFNASSKYSVLRMKTEDSSVPTEARSPYRYHDHLIRFTAVGIELPQTDTVKIKIVLKRRAKQLEKQPANKANGNQKSLGQLKGAKNTAR